MSYCKPWEDWEMARQQQNHVSKSAPPESRKKKKSIPDPHKVFLLCQTIQRLLESSSIHFNLYTDATPHQGGWVSCDTSRNKLSCNNFTMPSLFQDSSFEFEFYAVQRGIIENSSRRHIHLHCDHQGVYSMLKSGVFTRNMTYPHVAAHYRSLMSFIENNSITLTVSWIASEINPADDLSRCTLLASPLETTLSDEMID